MASGPGFMNRSKDPRLTAYSAVRQVGKGSYGEVFLVQHLKEKKQYVMKNIKLTASSAKERLAAEQEAALLGKLKHPNIVSYKESFQDEFGMLHIVMGYCEGGDLCTRLNTHKGDLLPETQVVEWFVQIALALQYLHQHNILHRDLKTQNIFLSKNDIIKVGDLGIARVLDGSCDLAHTVIGTPYYMSPELFANQPYNHKSDIWALGCCVYEMATLKHAFKAKNINALMYKIIKGKVPALPSVFSAELSELVQQMMDHKPQARPNVHQLLRNSFVRSHIKLFLERAAGKKRKSSQKPPPAATRDLEECSLSPLKGKNRQRVALPQPEGTRPRRSSTGSRHDSQRESIGNKLSPVQFLKASSLEAKKSTSHTSLPQTSEAEATKQAQPSSETKSEDIIVSRHNSSETRPRGSSGSQSNSPETKPRGASTSRPNSPETKPRGASGSRSNSPETKPRGASGSRSNSPETKPRGASGSRSNSPETKPRGASGSGSNSSETKPRGTPNSGSNSPETKPRGASGSGCNGPVIKPKGTSGSGSNSPETKPKEIICNGRVSSEVKAKSVISSQDSSETSHTCKPVTSNRSSSPEAKLKQPVESGKGGGIKKRPKLNFGQHKPPRPLPPDPSPKTGSTSPTQSGIRKVSSNDNLNSPASGGSVSSARQRRRRNKQLESGVARGRVVLRSRSSSDLVKRASDESLSSKASGEDVADGLDEPLGEGPQQEIKKLDSQEIKSDAEADPCVYGKKEIPVVSHVETHNPEEQEPNSAQSVTTDARDGTGSSDEVDEFLTLLDTTLYLPELHERQSDKSAHTPQSKEAFIEENKCPLLNEVSHMSLLNSGRLEDRIVALRRLRLNERRADNLTTLYTVYPEMKECLIGLGEALMVETSRILNEHEPDEVEDLLLEVLGKERFDLFAAKLQHLNLCEETITAS